MIIKPQTSEIHNLYWLDSGDIQRRATLVVLPELRVIAVNRDRLWNIERISEDKLHVLSRAQAGVEQVLSGDGLAQHVGDALCLAAIFYGIDM